MMTKINRIEHRGTEVHKREIEPQNWAGDSYREKQSERFETTPKTNTMHIGRGIKTVRVEDIPSPKPRPSTEGMTRITNRGTNSRKSENTGTEQN